MSGTKPVLRPRKASFKQQFSDFWHSPGEAGVAVTALLILMGAIYTQNTGHGVQQSLVVKQNPGEIVDERLSDGPATISRNQLPEALRASTSVASNPAPIPEVRVTVDRVVTVTMTHTATHTVTPTPSPTSVEPTPTSTSTTPAPDPTSTTPTPSSTTPSTTPTPTSTSTSEPQPTSTSPSSTTSTSSTTTTGTTESVLPTAEATPDASAN